MKINSEKTNEVEILGADAKKFSVDTSNSMIISLLRDRMYKNKIGAVAREIASNSRDANREAGRGDVPIIISFEDSEFDLLSESEMSISFQDNGIGISPERMDKIFIKYGSSTKRDSDEFTGGFGIGAKTPFAYSDNFFIETIVENNGIKTKYSYQSLIATDENGQEETNMILLFEEITKENTGTKITVPIKNKEDREKFEFEVIYATYFWNVQPKFNNFISNLKTKDVVYEDDNSLIIYNTQLFKSNNKFIILVDEIPYEIDSEILKSRFEKIKEIRYRNSFKWIYKFNTGEISVSGSREDIEHTASNEIKIIERIKDTLNLFDSLSEEMMNISKSYLESCLLLEALNFSKNVYSSSFNTVSDILKTENLQKYNTKLMFFLGELLVYKEVFNEDLRRIFLNFHYNNKRVIAKLSFQHLIIHKYNISNNSGKMLGDKGYLECKFSDINDLKDSIYFLDVKKKTPSQNLTLKLRHEEHGYIIITTDSTEETSELKEFKNLGIEVKLYSEIEKTISETKRKYSKSDVINVPVKIIETHRYGSICWDSINLKYDKKSKKFFEKEGTVIEQIERQSTLTDFNKICYITKKSLSDFSNKKTYNRPVGIDEKQEEIRKILRDEKVVLIGISEQKEKYFKENNIKSLTEMFEILLKNKKKSEKIIDVIFHSIVKNSLFSYKILKEINLKKEVKNALENVNNKFSFINSEIEKKNTNDYFILSRKINLINLEFLSKFHINVENDVIKDFEIINKFIEESDVLKMLLEIQKTGRFVINDEDKKEIFKNSKNEMLKIIK
jgi:hypothetical protein